MTGSRAFRCLFCRILRVIEINRRIHHINSFRLPAATSCINKRRAFSSSPWLLEKSRDSDPENVSSLSDSSSSDSSSSESSESESDSDQDVIQEKKSTVKQPGTPDLLSLLKAGEKKWGADKGLESKLKSIEHSIDSKLVTEAKKLSEQLPGDQVKTESALLGQLLTQFETTANQRKGAEPKVMSEKTKAKGLSDIMEGITVKTKSKKYSRSGDKSERFEDYSDYSEDRARRHTFREPGIGLFSGKPLGIFTKEDMKSAHAEKKSLFEIVEEEERNQLHFYPPKNAFEEQIQWTKEGKLWTFPIDNEAGWEEENKVEFHEHVFLENQLAVFPKKGPIRHFMELVTTALSKNPYLTVEQKHEHIDWYRNYFSGKQDILEERLGRDGLIAAQE